MKKIPVLVLAFNRPDHVKKALEPVYVYQPERLYLACDGARLGKSGESDLVEATKKAMLEIIDWPCDVKTLFRRENLGCARAVFEAISWFFEHEEYGIIIEDDIIVSQDFFKLCEELLPMYADNTKIQQIDAFLPVGGLKEANTYSFTKRPMIWGWASWRRAWQDNMDMEMKAWPTFRILSMIGIFGIIRTLFMYRSWSLSYKKRQAPSSWGTLWHFAAWTNNLISICPLVNLSKNIGLSSEGAHYNNDDKEPYSQLEMGQLNYPLIHPKAVELDKTQVKADNLDFFRMRYLGAMKIIRKWKKRLF